MIRVCSPAHCVRALAIAIAIVLVLKCRAAAFSHAFTSGAQVSSEQIGRVQIATRYATCCKTRESTCRVDAAFARGTRRALCKLTPLEIPRREQTRAANYSSSDISSVVMRASVV